MGTEIERKFLVRSPAWRGKSRREIEIVQGYLSTDADRTIRVRICDDRAVLTIKGRPQGLVRREFEYEIPVEDARQLLADFCEGQLIEKRRYEVPVDTHLWEVDVFSGANQGLVVAEVELSRPDEKVKYPSWIGDEVTGEVRYYNARLVEEPYRDWDEHPTP